MVGETHDKSRILCLESSDGLMWSESLSMIDYSDISPITLIESPILWRDDGEWSLLYWETRIGDDFSSGLRHLNSSDGENWLDCGIVSWSLHDEKYCVYPYDKLLLSDVVLGDDGVSFTGRAYMSGLEGIKTWRTCTINALNLTESYAEVSCLIYKDHLETEPRAVFPVQVDGVYHFIYRFDSGEVILGDISDYSGLDQRYLENP